MTAPEDPSSPTPHSESPHPPIPNSEFRIPNSSFPPLRQEDGPAWRGYLLLGAVVLCYFLACWKPVQDPDTFWHLAVGRDFWQTGHLLRSETFSFTAPGAAWVNEEWLFQVVAYPLWKAGGDPLLQCLTALCGALAAAIAWRTTLRLGASPGGASIYLFLLCGVYAERLRFRPEMVSLVLMAILVDRLALWTEAPAGWKHRAPLLACLFFLWVQTHGAWAYGMLYLGLFLAGAMLDGARRGERLAALAMQGAATLSAAVAVLFLNPFGWRLPMFPLRHLLSFFDRQYVNIAEWQRTPFHGLYLLFVCVALGGLAAALLERSRFRWKEFLPASGQVALGLYWVRYVAYSVVALAGVVAPRLRRLEPAPRFKGALAWGAFAGGVVLIVLRIASPPAWPVMTERYPVQETAFLKANDLRGNLFHEFRVGGFLEWTLGPGWKVFIDGRYGPFNRVGLDYYAGHKTPETFRALLEQYPADIAIMSYPAYTFPNDPPAAPRGPSAVLFPNGTWALVYFGDYGMVLLRREPRWKGFIECNGYKTLRPDDLPYLVWTAWRDPSEAGALQEDLRRSLAQDCPPALRPRFEAALRLMAVRSQGGNSEK